MYSVYKIFNKENNSYYIGSAINVKKRWRQHENALNGGIHRNKHLQNAWNKYGEKSFEFISLILVSDKNVLLEREQFYIDMGVLMGRKLMYNINLNVSGFHGRKHTEKTKLKMSQKRMGISLTKGEKNPNAKLDHIKVKEIRELYLTNNYLFSQLGKIYGVSYVTISGIVKNKFWKL